MLITCWAAKGGSGTTVVVAALAATMAARRAETVAIDLAGDLPAAMGLAEPQGSGVLDWVAAPDAPDPGALRDLARPVDHGLHLLARGDARPAPDHPRGAELAAVLAAAGGCAVVDCGTAPPPPALVEAARHAWLVTRPCYLAMRAALAQPPHCRPSGVVLVGEPGRALKAADVSATLQAPVVAELPLDPAVARAVDAGLVLRRLPRWVTHALGGAA